MDGCFLRQQKAFCGHSKGTEGSNPGNERSGPALQRCISTLTEGLGHALGLSSHLRVTESLTYHFHLTQRECVSFFLMEIN